MRQRSEDEWEGRFGGTVPDAAGNTIWATSRAEELPDDPATVWSVIEGEGDSLYLLPGHHVVNLIGYVVSEEARTAAEDADGSWAEVLWFDGADLNHAP